MAIPINEGDVIRILLKGTMPNGQPMLNVFHYEFYAGSTTDTGSHVLENFAFGFWENIKDALRAVTNTAFLYQQVEAVVLDEDFNQVNGEGFTIPTGEQAGSVGGDYATRMLCWTFRYVRPALFWRHGMKRFAGVSETQLNGQSINPASAAAFTTLAAALAADIGGFYPDATPLVDPPDARPVVYRAVFNGDPLSPVEYMQPLSVIFSHVGTQNTRK